jgi:arabinofuranosyltransferase
VSVDRRSITPRAAALRFASANRSAVLGAAVFAAVAVRLAWLSDDGAITARVIANTLTGYGPNYNITERAQAFTHPLWFMLNTALSAVTSDTVLTMLFVGLLCAGGAVYLVLRDRHWVIVAVVTLALVSSYAMTEYAISGLENPLSWLLIAVMWRSAKHSRPLWAAIAGGLLVLNRLDLALVAIPFLTLWMARRPIRNAVRLRAAAVVVGPSLAWMAFSWMYYGSPLPETAYGKLNTAIPTRELVGQGVRYALDLSINDAIAAVLILLGLGLAWNARISFESLLIVASGVVLYGGYTIAIGGDFMSGRFWTVPVFASVIAVSDALEQMVPQESAAWVDRAPVTLLLAAALFGPVLLAPAVGLPAFRDPFSPQPRGTVDIFAADGIVDEWTYYVMRERTHGFLQWVTQDPFDSAFARMHTAVKEWQPRLVVDRIDVRCGGAGYEGLVAGPTVHLVVPCGLADPFFARTEFEAQDQAWRIGHFERPIPPGYFEALSSGSADHLPAHLRQDFIDNSLPRRIPGRWSPDFTP